MADPARTAVARRQEIRRLSGIDTPLWLQEPEKGFARIPRTLPLLAVLMRRPELSGNRDPSSAYLELHTRHLGEGVVELTHEADHAYASGYTGNRAVRTWRDRMRLLEDLGFVRIMSKLGRRFGYALLLHPSLVVARVREEGKIDEGWMRDWWIAYRARQTETGETRAEKLGVLDSDGDAEPSGPMPPSARRKRVGRK